MLKAICNNLVQKAVHSNVKPAIVTASRNIQFLENADPNAVKRGAGGRSSFSGKTVTIFGGSSKLAYHVVGALVRDGTQVLLPYRSNLIIVERLRYLGDLGQVLICNRYTFEPKKIHSLIEHSDVVINLIGKDNENSFYDLELSNSVVPTQIAQACKDVGVKDLVTLTPVSCHWESPGFFGKGGSKYLKYAYQGELAMREVFPDLTVFRCSAVLGTNMDNYLLRLVHPGYNNNLTSPDPLPNMGRGIWKQPVYATDVASGIRAFVKNSQKFRGQTFDIVGPRRYELCEMVDYFYRCSLRSNDIKDYKDCSYYELYKYGISKEVVEQMFIDDITCGNPSLRDLGVTDLATFEDYMAIWTPFTHHWQFRSLHDGIADPPDSIEFPNV